MVRCWIYLKGRGDMICFELDFKNETKRRVKDHPKVLIPRH